MAPTHRPAKPVLLLAVVTMVAGEGDKSRPVRWGVMGTGTIASDFVRVLKSLPDVEVAAIGSRTAEKAETFASVAGVSSAALHPTYEDLVADDTLDIVYIATPSSRHVEDSLACLEAGRAVLCEKSMAGTAEEAARVLEKARSQELFFLHGVWSRFFPAMAELRRVIESGAIGEVCSVHASFCQNDGAGSCSAMAETGIYCAQFLLWVYGGVSPTVQGVAYSLDPQTGHDTHVSANLQWPCGGVGSFECSLRHPSPRSATICGTKGVIEVPFPFWCPDRFTVQTMDGLGSQTFGKRDEHIFPLPEIDAPGSADAERDFNFVNSQGLRYEAAEATRCLREGALESELFSSDECLRVMQLVSEIRASFKA